MATHRCCPKTKESGKLKKSLHDVSGRPEASTVLCGGTCQFDVVSVSLVSSVVSVASVKSFLGGSEGPHTGLDVTSASLAAVFFLNTERMQHVFKFFFFALRASTRRSGRGRT